MKIRFIGDTHGSFTKYQKLIGDAQNTIQVGDFGIGFGMEQHLHKVDPTKHRFIRGNHDDPVKAKEFPHFIQDGFYDGMFFVGGAKSVDQKHRTEGVDWWKNEEVSYGESMELLSQYEQILPAVVVTHDCPTIALNGIREQSMTAQLFDAMFEIHVPKFWIFGHHHWDDVKTIKGCEFVCVYNKVFDLDLSEV